MDQNYAVETAKKYFFQQQQRLNQEQEAQKQAIENYQRQIEAALMGYQNAKINPQWISPPSGYSGVTLAPPPRSMASVGVYPEYMPDEPVLKPKVNKKELHAAVLKKFLDAM